jgi:hypothetical protein
MVQTHALTVTGDTVVKQYTSWQRGEPGREWAILTHLHRYAPGLGPAPVRADLCGHPPTVVMRRLPGTPLCATAGAQQRIALSEALRRLWSVPVTGVPPRRLPAAELAAMLLRELTDRPRPAGTVGAAVGATLAFLAGRRTGPPLRPVLGHSDPNLANYLWDGRRVRIVDFEDAGSSDIPYELGTLVEHRTAIGGDWAGLIAGFDVDPARLLDSRRLAAAHWLVLLLRRTPATRGDTGQAPHGHALHGQALRDQALRLLDLLQTG